MLDAKLSHIALGATDPQSARRFYEDVLGLGNTESLPGRTRLGLGGRRHVLELTEGSELGHLALEVDEEALHQLGERLRETEVDSWWAPPDGDHPPALRFNDPEAHGVELHVPVERSGEGLRSVGRRPIGLHHITLSAMDVPALARFYTEVLGFRVSDRMGDRFVWLRCNREHHTVAIVQGERGGLDHICFEVSDWEELKYWCDSLALRDIPLSWGPGRHGPGNNLFVMFDDPDGVHIELSCEMERFWDDRAEYHEPRNWAPELRTVNLWGPAPDWRRPLQDAAQ